jgi:subtilisin family serine protease
MKNWLRLAGSVTAVMLMSSLVSAAAPAAEKPADYLVSFKAGAGPANLKAAGVNMLDHWSAIGAAHVRANSTALSRLQANGVIEYFEPDALRHTMGTYNDALPITWGLQAVHTQEAWNLGAKGAGIKVCILDTGITYSHPEFQKADGTSVIKGSKNFVADGHADATDGNHHGTHVAGTIAAQGKTVWGVAPNADLYIGRVLDDTGSGTSSAIMNGVTWCTDTVHANIISMSLGGSTRLTTEDRAYTSAYNKGVLTIAAAGNAGTSALSYPAGYTNVVSVAAVDSNLAKASFSQYNSDVELAGPGVSVLSSVPQGTGLRGDASEGTTTYTAHPLEYAGKGSVTGPLVECGIADTTTACTGMPATGSWIALINRGTNTFANKIANVTTQGAAGAIIANNDTAAPDDAGSFTLGSAGTYIPAVSVSYNSGVAIRSGGLASGSVSVSAWDYAYFDGTSMATPHAAAVAALAWSAKPALTNVKIRSVLQTTAKDLGAAGRDVNFGYGLVQADAAVNKAKTTP